MTPEQLLTLVNQHTGYFLLIMVWVLAWKGWALWRAATRKDLGWFIIILLLNTLGLLEIIYIFLISRDKRSE